MRVHRRWMPGLRLIITWMYDTHMETVAHMGRRLGNNRLGSWHFGYTEASVGAPIGGVHFEEVV